MRELNAFYDVLDQFGPISTVDIDRESYGKGNTIFGFVFKPYRSSNDLLLTI